MMRALLAGITGLRSHQVRMDVIGDNIANANTLGFKASRASFQETLAQKMGGAPSGFGGLGRGNLCQVGTGTRVGSIESIFTQGSIELTGRPLDLAIEGQGLFAVRTENGVFYTRAGNFQLDATGRLVLPGVGAILQGVAVGESGLAASPSAISDIAIPLNARDAARATGIVRIAGHLDSTAAEGSTTSVGSTVYDAAGVAHDLVMTFTKGADDGWTWTATCDSAPVADGATGTVAFDEAGNLASFTYPGGGSSLQLTPAGGGAFAVSIDAAAGDAADGLTSHGGTSRIVVEEQDGRPAGDLLDLQVDSSGAVIGYFTNGVTRVFAQISLAAFHNPDGLVRSGENLYSASESSGAAVYGFAGTGAQWILSQALEGSNVDISQEFSNMIITQRGYQASARVVMTADEMLNEIVNLLR